MGGKIDFYLIASGVIFTASFIIGGYLINFSPEKSKEYGKLILEKEEIIKQNNQIKAQIFFLGSIDNIQKEAVRMGITSQKLLPYVTSPY